MIIMVIFDMIILLVLILLLNMKLNDIDYEDIYDNINDYEYPYNHINREGVWDMDKTLIQNIIAVTNKAIDTTSVKYTIETKDNCYYAYNGVYYNDDSIEFTDDYDNDVVLSYDEVVGIKVSGLWYERNDVDKSVAESTPPTTLLSYHYSYI